MNSSVCVKQNQWKKDILKICADVALQNTWSLNVFFLVSTTENNRIYVFFFSSTHVLYLCRVYVSSVVWFEFDKPSFSIVSVPVYNFCLHISSCLFELHTHKPRDDYLAKKLIYYTNKLGFTASKVYCVTEGPYWRL